MPGAFLTAVGWQVLQLVGAVYATAVLASTSALNQTFGLVLGLIGLIFIAALIAVSGSRSTSCSPGRLWPRALLTPFTDAVDLTDADRRAYALYAQTQRHKGFESVTVRFEGRDGDTHEIEQRRAADADGVTGGSAAARAAGGHEAAVRAAYSSQPGRCDMVRSSSLAPVTLRRKWVIVDRGDHGEQRRAASRRRRAPTSQMPHQTQASPK